MYYLGELLRRRRDAWASSQPVAVAFVSRSYRSVDHARGVDRQVFGSRFPPLGLLNLAAALRVDAPLLRHEPRIRIFDEEDFASVDVMAECVRTWLEDGPDGPTLIGATSYTHTVPELEDFLDRFDPGRHLIVVGGAHVTVQPLFDHAHVVVRGEGRVPLRHIINEFGRDGFLTEDEATGVAVGSYDGRRSTRPAFDGSMRELPSPPFAYDLVQDSAAHFSTHAERAISDRPQIYVCTQSCRARCSFCSTYLIHGTSKSRPVELVREDLRHLFAAGHDGIEFWDDDLLQHEEFDDLLETLREFGRPWFCFGRVETIDTGVARALADAGCRRIFLGIESMSQERLDYFNKRTTVQANRDAVRALDAAGIGAIGGFILGVPEDTVDSILEMYHEYLALPLLAISTSILAPDPGTREFARARMRGGPFLEVLDESDGRRVRPDLERFGGDAPAGLPTLCESVSKPELNALTQLVEAHFITRPEIWARFRTTTPSSQLWRVRAWFRHLREQASAPLPDGTSAPVGALREEILSRPQPWQDR